MAERTERFEVTVPAGTAIIAPQTTALTMNPGVTRRAEILVPPGPSGLVGFRLLHSGTIVIPRSGTKWIIADDFTFVWDLDGYPVGDRWSLRAYNTDIYDHTLYVTWHLDEVPASAPTPLAPIPIG